MLPKEVTYYIGKTEVRIFPVERGAIFRFAEAIEDPNPLYWDDEYARKSRYGSIIAPPGFWGWMPNEPTEDEPFGTGGGSQRFRIRGEVIRALAKAGYTRVMDGGHAYEFYQPVRAGDTLTCCYKIADIVEKKGRRTAKLAFLIQETTYINQHGTGVGKWNQDLIARWKE
jgi:acyl dehydratase